MLSCCSCFRPHRGSNIYTMLPVKGFIHQRNSYNIEPKSHYKRDNSSTGTPNKSKVQKNSGTVKDNRHHPPSGLRPPKMIASMGTPSGSCHLSSIIGHWAAGVQNLLGKKRRHLIQHHSKPYKSLLYKTTEIFDAQ